MKRRDFLVAGAALTGASAMNAVGMVSKTEAKFPKGFLWGTATSGHQTEGNNTASDLWFLENVKPTVFAEPSGDACNSFALWETDLQLVKDMGLNSYRFSLEWARIEPEPGLFSIAMLDYYKQRIQRCKAMGIIPQVTFCHFVAPRWFSEQAGWLNPAAPELFARYVKRAAEHLSEDIGYAITLNEPNLTALLNWDGGLPKFVLDKQRATLKAAAEKAGVKTFTSANVMNYEDYPLAQEHMLKGHRLAFNAIKAVRSDLPVGVSLAINDDQVVGNDSRHRDKKRETLYGPWLETAKQDDFLGVQNYERSRIDANGELPPPKDAVMGLMGKEVYPASLANAVEYAHSVCQKPVLVTEHGVSADDDEIRSWLIPQALKALQEKVAAGVPVLGYTHWTLLDNFEWVFGYGPKFGLHSVDRQTFKRTPKQSAQVLGNIARRNAV
ncbi:glycoside hydrolase family 1 protein [Aestuariicella hydrocarbonica]|uniref:Glycoside hydrolase family 1 protein n=1 Tax=Pseudomaricurvus hydrocarbonicus TaxID=1470433 RepID=A0A9E5JTY5_9GAMM|nr:family 1 glycosylhydrolase [Aestuariicella hydrocarbonica]NHO66792.1 glycoside hydrolase family 1 protein [Aestuariicella hydrocarbonica]